MKTAIRTSTINIDTIVPDGVQWVNATIQRVEVDDNDKIVSLSPRDKQLHRRIDEVAFETIKIYDMVLGKEIDISVAGVGTAIEALLVRWMLEDNPTATYDETTKRVVLDGTR